MNIAIHPLTRLFRCFAGRRRELQIPQHVHEDLAIDAYEMCAQEIADGVLNPIVTKAHRDETLDREAARLMDDVLADGKVDASEIAKLKTARAQVLKSAELAHDAGELATFQKP